MTDRLKIQEYADGATFEVWLQPRSSQRAVVGVHDGALKIKIVSPPLEGKANKECLQYLAGILSVRPSELRILSGMNARRKLVFVPLSVEKVREIVAKY